jgi:hypothetical protein
MKRLRARLRVLAPLAVLGVVVLSVARGAPASPVQELRVQRVGEVTYFHLRIEPPKDLLPEAENPTRGWFTDPVPELTTHLVSPDGKLRLVCQRVDRNARSRVRWEGPAGTPPVEPGPAADTVPGQPRQPVEVRGLEFVGRCDAKGEVKVKLLYPVEGKRPRVIGRFVRTPPQPVWKELELTLDLGKAKQVALPKEAAQRTQPAEKKERRAYQPPHRDDLEGLWAVAQVDQFLMLDNQVQEFGYYGFAALATARKYGVQSGDVMSRRLSDRIGRSRRTGPPGQVFDGQLYELTTGAAAITESLQLRRMNSVAPRGEERTVDVKTVRGIDIAEHPWKEMIGDRKPAPEAFARLVPHDNYYLHFKNVAKFIEFSELLDQWGTNITRTYELTSRDHKLKERYAEQLCIKATGLGKTLGPLVIKGVAVTGNDAYIREGSDVTLIFLLNNKTAFLGAVEPFLAEARKKYGDRLKESKNDYHGVTIESYVTPFREVSLHRAAFEEYMIYANSLVGLRRVIDTAQKREKSLADSLDFQYMRTVFRYDDPSEDGFAFLSDPFIRNLVGPASKIKEKRRVEALASLHMLTSGALYTAWETGRPPVSEPNILQAAGLKREELPMPEGKNALWDPEHLLATSDAYNTIHFATPLIELPITKVTPTEAAEYERFRLEYLGLWRQYFDPIGLRVSLREGKVKLDTYILPLIENSAYNSLKAVTGNGTVKLDPAALSNKALFQYMMHLSEDANERGGWFGAGRGRETNQILMMIGWALDPVGKWVLFRVDDSPNYARLLRLAEKADNGEEVNIEEVARLVWSLPVALGVDIKNPLTFAGALGAARNAVMMALPGALTWGPLEKDYKGVQIVRIQATPVGREMLGPLVRGERPGPGKDAFLPAVYYAMLDGGFYLTLNEEMLHQLIDSATARREGKVETVDVNTSLHLAPGAAEHSMGLIKRMLERQTHDQAMTALPIWYVLYRAGVVKPDATPEQAQAAAYRYLGFVPVSPDNTPYRYDAKSDEVVNERHGSFRKPVLHKTTAEDAPLNKFLEQVRSIRADLRFREDGIHTVLTIDRGTRAK